MTKKYGVLYCLWQDERVIKFSEVIEASNLKDAIEKTDCNIESNVVIPFNDDNKEFIRKLLKEWD